jgi:hypothetical protein
MDKLITVILVAAFAFCLVVALSLVFAIFTMWAYNGSVAEMFHVQQIGFVQAFWLNVLGGLLCKSSSGSKS